MPDDASTVQSAIDSGADTVLIREGIYPERPVVNRAIALQGVTPGMRPRLIGLQVYNSNFFQSPPLLDVKEIAFTGRVTFTTLQVHPRRLVLSFYRCTLDSGLQVMNRDSEDIAMLSIYNSRMAGSSGGQVDDLFMVADTIDGGVTWRARHPAITDCWFRGGSGPAIEISGDPVVGPVSRNRIEHYDNAIQVQNPNVFAIEDNVIGYCGTGIALSSASEVNVRRNDIRNCDVGIYVGFGDAVYVGGNVIIGARGTGVAMSDMQYYRGPLIEGNVIGQCGGAGIALDRPEDVTMRRNTVFRNAGSGILLTRSYGVAASPIVIDSNIGFGNAGWGLSVPAGEAMVLACNDWYLNGLGAVVGATPGTSDLSVDPEFCGVDSADVRLDSSSPLVDGTGCGQIGALGVGCGVTATVVQRFSAARVNEGVKVVWSVADGAAASEIWIERSDSAEGAAWTRPLTERWSEDQVMVELDRSVAADRTCWYRLVALEGSEMLVIGAPIPVQAGPIPAFQLVQVGPNPGGGPLRISFALKRTATIAIDVYDIQGRRVASPGRGSWPAGTHTVEWSGQTDRGDLVPSGLYFLRYHYPGGQDRMALVRTH